MRTHNDCLHFGGVRTRSAQHLDSTCVYFTCLFIYLFVAVLYEKLETSSHTLIVRIYILVLSHCCATTVLCVYSVQNPWHSIDVVCFKWINEEKKEVSSQPTKYLSKSSWQFHTLVSYNDFYSIWWNFQFMRAFSFVRFKCGKKRLFNFEMIVNAHNSCTVVHTAHEYRFENKHWTNNSDKKK